MTRDANADDTSIGPVYNLEGGQLQSSLTQKGFTNRRHLDAVELIHMNDERCTTHEQVGGMIGNILSWFNIYPKTMKPHLFSLPCQIFKI